MRESQIHDALNDLPEELIAPVASLRAKKRYPWVKWAAIAAGICLVLALPQGIKAENAAADAALDGSMEIVADREVSSEGIFGCYSDSSVSGNSIAAVTFRAKVLEVYETYILVEPLEGEDVLRSSDKIEVSFAKLKEIPELKVGDVVEITYSGMLEEVYPARANGVTKIEIAE